VKKRSIIFQTPAAHVCVVQAAPGLGLNAHAILKRVRDGRFALDPAQSAAQVFCFLLIEIVDHTRP